MAKKYSVTLTQQERTGRPQAGEQADLCLARFK